MRWGMVVDLRRCAGCQTCTIACMQEHALPAGVQWRTVADCEVGTYPDVRRVFLPLACMHCADPPCVPVCPTGASRRRTDGIVWVDHASCLGCGYCAMACPYRARHLVASVAGHFETPTPSERATARPERRGVMSKCTFCLERVDRGRDAWLTPGADAPATPACAAACIAGAIAFGDLDDPASPVARLVEGGGAVPLSPECGTRPSVYYVGPGSRQNGGAAAARPHGPRAVARDAAAAPPARRATLVPGTRQRLWKAPAVANFALGGLGAGLYLTAAAAGPPAALALASWLGPALVLAGFAAVAAEAGRPLRGALALRRLRTSWMSRELALGLLFAAAAGAGLLAPTPALRALAAVAALGLAVAQGFVLRRARGVAAWDVPIMPLVFLASALVGGAGLYLALETAAGRPAPPAVLVGSLALLGVGLATWLAYLSWSADEVFARPTRALREASPGFALVAGGYVVPSALVAAALAVEVPAAAGTAGVLMVAAQVAAKWWLVVEAGELRPITIDSSVLRRRPS